MNEPQLSFTKCIYVRYRKKQLWWQVSTYMPSEKSVGYAKKGDDPEEPGNGTKAAAVYRGPWKFKPR